MISPLQAFLIEDCESPKEYEVIISERLKDHPFKVRSLSLNEYDEIRKQSVAHGEDGSRVDSTEIARNLAVAGCIEPDFKDAEFLSKCGCMTPSQALEKVLHAGEVLKLSDEIMKASGFSNDLNKLKKEAKN